MAPKMSNEQKQYLLNYLKENPNLIHCKFSSTFTYVTTQKLWKRAAAALNDIDGARKDWRGWKRSWIDVKKLLKKKYRKEKKQVTGTNSPIIALTPLEREIIDIARFTTERDYMEEERSYDVDYYSDIDIKDTRLIDPIAGLSSMPSKINDDATSTASSESSNTVPYSRNCECTYKKEMVTLLRKNNKQCKQINKTLIHINNTLKEVVNLLKK